jgi:hypothetical protein
MSQPDRTRPSAERDTDLVMLRNRSLAETLTSRHLGSLLALYVFLGAGLLFCLMATVSPSLRSDLGIDKPVAILLPLVAAFVGGLIKVYDVADSRLGTVDLFTNEILNVARVINATSLIDVLILQYYAPRFATYPEANRNENYMVIFDSHSKDLGFLPRQAIAQVTAFYTLLKGARDARGMLAVYGGSDMTPEDAALGKRHTILRTIYLLFLALEAGYYAVHLLVTDAAELEQYDRLFLRSSSLAYLFLSEHLPDTDDRRGRLQNERRARLFNNARLSQYEATYAALTAARL